MAETPAPSPAAGANEAPVRWDKCRCGMQVAVPVDGHAICSKCGRRNR